MNKNTTLKLTNIHYGGDSVGEDIILEVSILGKTYKLDRRIKIGDTLVLNQEVAQFTIPGESLESDLIIKVTEKDFLFSDKGQTTHKLQIQADSLPQEFRVEVKVQERRITLRKSTAVFTINFTIEPSQEIPKVKPYNAGPKGEDYNIYDQIIEDQVKHWNDEFRGQQDPPPHLLDPNLVKAMIYIESKVGNYQPKTGYSGYPDVMQVADPRNDAIYALKNIYNPNPARKKIATEYDVINGKLTKLHYTEANGDRPEDSIKWGTRWLYHLAQKNIQANNTWSRQWKDWKEAVYYYNVNGDKDYVDKVYKALAGAGDGGYKLRNIAIFVILGLGLLYGGLYSGLTVYDRFMAETAGATPQVAGVITYQEISHSKQQPTVQPNPAIKENAQPFNGYGYVGRLRWDNYPPTDCTASKDFWDSGQILKNCTYTVGSNWSKMWTVKLTDGGYAFTPEPFQNFDYYDNEGPRYVTFENYAIGDLDKNGLNDAVAVLRLNGGGTGYWLNMVVLVQQDDGRYKQVANYMFEDREVIRGLSIDDSIITARVITKAEDDPVCCASIYDTYRFKIVD